MAAEKAARSGLSLLQEVAADMDEGTAPEAAARDACCSAEVRNSTRAMAASLRTEASAIP